MKSGMANFCAVALVLIAFTFGTVPALAGPGTDLVKSRQTALFDLLSQSRSDPTKKIEGILAELIDYDALTQASFGAGWPALSDAEKAELTGLLRQLVQRAYVEHVRPLVHNRVEYLGEESVEGALIVKTRSKSQTPPHALIGVNYKLVPRNGTWKVTDIITEGVSLVGGFHMQFTNTIRRDGLPALLQKMKDILAKGGPF